MGSSSMTVIKNARIICSDRIIPNGSVAFADGKIIPLPQFVTDAHIIDAKGQSYTHDRSHQRGDEHGANDYRD